MSPRIGLLGGSFDPPHLGHLRLALAALEQTSLTQVRFLPAGQSPFKPDGPVAAPLDRLHMLESMIEGVPGLSVESLELERSGPSYTIETIQTLREREPGSEFVWLMGSDLLEGLPEWHRAQELASELEFLCFRRAGYLGTAEAPAGFRVDFLDWEAPDISSSEIRRKLENNLPVDTLVHEAVATFLEERELYKTVESQPEAFESERGPMPEQMVQELGTCLRALDDRKTEAISVLDVRGRSSITDYLVLGTATSEPHMKAIRTSLEKTIKETGIRLVGTEYESESGWLVVDAFDFIVHVFLAETRENYDLEQLWGDAPKVDYAPLLEA